MNGKGAGGELNLHERLSFIGMDDAARTRLRALKPLIEGAMNGALDKFYQRVRSNSETSRFFRDNGHISAAKSKQADHWKVILTGNFGPDYAARVQTIGQTHARLGLAPRWYIGGYAVVVESLVESIIENDWPSLMSLGKGRGEATAQAIAVLVKAMMLDIDLAISTYLEALEQERKRAEEAREIAATNQQQALAVLAAALATLSNGDLTTRIDQNLSADFDGIKSDFNAAVAKLQEAMLNVSGSSGMIAASTQQIAAAADDLSKRTEQQAASLEETAAALDEITATVRKSAEGSIHAREVVMSANSDAEKAGVIVSRAVEAMRAIEKSSREINQIIGVIDEIAFQTNLLALNAGVEAARAGDAGRGFAVVASEVRGLAQRSAEAAKEIKSLISSSTAQVGTGVTLVSETGQALQRIAQQVMEINTSVANIAAGAQEQATGLAQVNSAMNQMDQVTQQNASMVEETTAASHTLTEKSVELDRLIGAFKLGGHAARGSAPKPAAVRSAPAPKRAARGGGAALATKEAPAAEEDWREF